MSIRLDRETFEALVLQALEELPEQFSALLDNVAVVVNDWPGQRTLRAAGLQSPYELLGFYHGIPQTERTSNYGLVAPDKISIYQRPIEAQCQTVDEVTELVGRVVRHEIAHHFGISDDRLRAIGAY
jgi:predicted Zn-dependent protease with MMP-like domain